MNVIDIMEWNSKYSLISSMLRCHWHQKMKKITVYCRGILTLFRWTKDGNDMEYFRNWFLKKFWSVKKLPKFLFLVQLLNPNPNFFYRTHGTWDQRVTLTLQPFYESAGPWLPRESLFIIPPRPQKGSAWYFYALNTNSAILLQNFKNFESFLNFSFFVSSSLPIW